MTASAKIPVYLILGAPGSGRREVLADLIESGLDDTDRPAVVLEAAEAPAAADARLPRLARWTWQAEDGFIAGALPPDAGPVFFVTAGGINPIDQIEAFRAWLEAQGGELARVFCVVHCALAEKHPPLLAWYDACVHFSDVVLLHRRDGVANKWVSDFLKRYEDQCMPCLFETVKAGRVRNPRLVLDPQARRLSHAFDGEDTWIFRDADGEEIDEQEEAEDEDEVEATPEEEPYFTRDAAGRRQKRIPDIGKYLEGSMDR
jgi:hypothetical protein